jgi:hypothetical protein
MHIQPWDAPDDPDPRPTPDDSAGSIPNKQPPDVSPDDISSGISSGISSDDSLSDDEKMAHLPVQLRNWRVLEDVSARQTPPVEIEVEIEGEATVLEERPDDRLDARLEDRSSDAARPYAGEIREQLDGVVIALLAQRRLEVTPGEAAALEVTLVNNGAWSALFEVTVEGWIDERWCDDLPVRAQLQPGEHYPLTITLTPPREPSCQAGEHPLAVVVRSPRYAGHVTRLAATVVVRPFVAFTFGPLRPRRLSTSWFQRSATLLAPLTNQGNVPATFQLHALDRRGQCDYRFLAGANAEGMDSAKLVVPPGQTVQAALEVQPVAQPWVRLFPQVTPFRVTARPVDGAVDDADQRQSLDAEVSCAPLVGPWGLAALGLLALVALVGSGLAGLTLLLALRTPQPPATSAPVAGAASAPVLALVLKIDEPVPTGLNPSGLNPAQMQSGAPLVQPGDVTAPGSAPGDGPATVDGAPVVRAEQVTAPGESLPPAAQTPLAPLPAAPQTQPAAPVAPGARANMTYAQMFQEIALRYDLNWRLLAAQAYVESGFDSVALSDSGDMGLMQIQPATWREWAPTVDAADPFDSYSNVLVAAVYLDYLRTLLTETGHPEQEWALVAYNWGPDSVLDHLATGETWESLTAERRQYALDILRIAESIPAQ